MDLATFDQTLLGFYQEKNTLHEAARYSLKGGKRLRPLLLFSVLDTFDIPREKGTYPACALEMVHTYSLIHDDLPCMDDDDIRREKPSLHKAFQESDAVLTGNFLLTRAFETLVDAPDLLDKQKCEMTKILSQRAGGEGMLEGQILDLKEDPAWKDTYLKKTSALFCAALEFGAVIARVPTEPFFQIGEHLGLAYQLLDDVADHDGVTKICGEESTQNMALEYLEKALSIIRQLPNGAPKLVEITKRWLCETSI